MRNFIFNLIMTVFVFTSVWAGTAPSSFMNKDVDGDGKNESFVFSLVYHDKESEAATLTVMNKNKVLWDDQWIIKNSDLQVLIEEDGRSNKMEWIGHFFENPVFGQAVYAERKLKEQEISDRVLKEVIPSLGPTVEELKKEILSQKVNRVFQYRRSWREDLMVTVYVPSLRRFVPFTAYGEE